MPLTSPAFSRTTSWRSNSWGSWIGSLLVGSLIMTTVPNDRGRHRECCLGSAMRPPSDQPAIRSPTVLRHVAVRHAGRAGNRSPSLVFVAAACGGDDAQDIPDNQQPIPTADAVITSRRRPPRSSAPTARPSTSVVVRAGRGAGSPRRWRPDRTDRDARSGAHVDADVRHHVWFVRRDARPRRGARDDSVAGRAGRGGVLRRHRVPPDRAGLRRPGRRPDRHRQGRTRLPDRRRAARRRHLHARCRGDGQGPGRRRLAPRAASSSSSPAPTPACPPEYAIVGEVTEGMDVVDVDRRARRPATEKPTQVILINTVTAAST